MTVSIQLSAQLDTQGLQAQLTDLTRRINAAGDAVAKANRLQFNPVSAASVQQAQRIEQSFARINKLAPDYYKRVVASGQQGQAWDQVDPNRMYSNPVQAARAQRQMFTLLTGLGFGGSTVTPPPGTQMVPAQGGSRGGGGPPSFGGRVLDTAFNNAGPIGRAAAGGIQAGRQAMASGGGFGGGIAAGLGFGLSSLALSGVAAVVGGIASHVGEAQQLSIMQADLYRRIGGRGTGNGYDALGIGVRGMSDRIGVDYQEAYGLAGMAARRSGVTRTGELTELVGTGGGFARSYGFDPSAGVSAFASMRGVGVTRNSEDTRRLGIAIAEGIARAGVFARAEEFLAEIANYGEQTTRSTLTRANVEGFAGALTALAGSGIPGLDPRGAAALLGRADQAIRGGGAAGEAGQAFLYQVLGRETGMDPMQVHALQEGGLFATGRNTFGRDAQGRLAIAGQHYADNGIAVPGGLAEDDTTNLERVIGGLRRTYGGANRRLLAEATSRMFGLGQRQSMALLGMNPSQLQGFGRLGLTTEQLNGMSETGIAMVGRIGASDDAGLNGIADEFRGRTGRSGLNAAERERLDAAQRSGDAEDLRKTLAELAAIKGAQETEGDRTRSSLQGINKAITDAASLLVGPLNTAAETLLSIAGKTRRGVAAHRLSMDLSEANDDRNSELAPIDEQISLLRRQYMVAANEHRAGPNYDRGATRMNELRPQIAALEAQRNEIMARHDAIISGINARANPRTTTAQANARADQWEEALKAEFGPGMTDAVAAGFGANAIAESHGGDPHAIGDSGQSGGIVQWNRQRREAFQRLFGHDVADRSIPADQLRREQAQFVRREMESTHRAAWDQIRRASTPEEAARLISDLYEIPADRNAGNVRAQIAAGRRNRTAPPNPAASTPGAAAAPASPVTQATAVPAGAPPNAVSNAAAAGGGAPPAGAAAASPAAQQVDVNLSGSVIMYDQLGNPLPAMVTVNPVVSAPRPSGSQPRPAR